MKLIRSFIGAIAVSVVAACSADRAATPPVTANPAAARESSGARKPPPTATPLPSATPASSPTPGATTSSIVYAAVVGSEVSGFDMGLGFYDLVSKSISVGGGYAYNSTSALPAGLAHFADGTFASVERVSATGVQSALHFTTATLNNGRYAALSVPLSRVQSIAPIGAGHAVLALTVDGVFANVDIDTGSVVQVSFATLSGHRYLGIASCGDGNAYVVDRDATGLQRLDRALLAGGALTPVAALSEPAASSITLNYLACSDTGTMIAEATATYPNTGSSDYLYAVDRQTGALTLYQGSNAFTNAVASPIFGIAL